MHFIDPTSPEPASPPAPAPPLPVASGVADSVADPEFNLVDVLLVLLAAVGALVFCGVAGGAILLILRGPHAINPKDPASAVMLIISIQVAAYAMTVGFMVFYVWEKYRAGFLRAVRWNMPAGKVAWLSVAGGSALGFGSVLAETLLRRWIPTHLPIDEFFKTPTSAYAVAAFGVLLAPAVEELFFRGFLYPALARRTGQAVGIAITAALFALLHAGQLALAWAPLLILFAVGSVLTLVRARTNSVATCVLVHAAYNLTLFTILFFATGHFHHMEKM